MATTLDRNFRNWIKDVPPAALKLLIVLMLHTNKRNRCFPSVRTLARETGYKLEALSTAKKWLIDHNAIEVVPFDKRVGKEEKLPKQAHVYQITGTIEINGKELPYLYINQSDNENVSEIETVEDAPQEGNVSKSETMFVSEIEISKSETEVLQSFNSLSSSNKEGNQLKDSVAPSGATVSASESSPENLPVPPEDPDAEPNPIDSFRQGWKEAMQGDTHPIEELWEGIEDESAETPPDTTVQEKDARDEQQTDGASSSEPFSPRRPQSPAQQRIEDMCIVVAAHNGNADPTEDQLKMYNKAGVYKFSKAYPKATADELRQALAMHEVNNMDTTGVSACKSDTALQTAYDAWKAIGDKKRKEQAAVDAALAEWRERSQAYEEDTEPATPDCAPVTESFEPAMRPQCPAPRYPKHKPRVNRP